MHILHLCSKLGRSSSHRSVCTRRHNFCVGRYFIGCYVNVEPTSTSLGKFTVQGKKFTLCRKVQNQTYLTKYGSTKSSALTSNLDTNELKIKTKLNHQLILTKYLLVTFL